ncbi:hypothetical protein DL767_010861 [Monosporascus sp. MG133]|nr:hypothetical protein DL767_010861 [Monosporascus sp. MG133]
MGDYYAGAVCTIASTGSPASEDGCFHTRKTLSLPPCKIGASSKDSLLPDYVYIRRDDISDYRRGVDQGILNARGAASELNATGFVYKSYPGEYGGNFLLTQDESWDREAIIARRLPPPDLSSDDLAANRIIWHESRAFLKENRRPSKDPWSDDSGNDSRFRSALDKLQSTEFVEDVGTGMFSFSHCWYEIVESYTRSTLTYSKDKLRAISGLVQQIESATKFDYVAGLWKQHIVTDMLWFTDEGACHRLLESSPTEQKKAPASKPSGASEHSPAEEQCNKHPSQHTEEPSSKPAETSTDILTQEQDDNFAPQHIQEASTQSSETSTDPRTEVQQNESPGASADTTTEEQGDERTPQHTDEASSQLNKDFTDATTEQQGAIHTIEHTEEASFKPGKTSPDSQTEDQEVLPPPQDVQEARSTPPKASTDRLKETDL